MIAGIVSADEEARSRVAFTEKRCAAELDAARREADALIALRRRMCADELQREIDAIRSEGDNAVEAIRARDDAFLSRAAANGEARLDEAAQLYARILVAGPEETP